MQAAEGEMGQEAVRSLLLLEVVCVNLKFQQWQLKCLDQVSASDYFEWFCTQDTDCNEQGFGFTQARSFSASCVETISTGYHALVMGRCDASLCLNVTASSLLGCDHVPSPGCIGKGVAQQSCRCPTRTSDMR